MRRIAALVLLALLVLTPLPTVQAASGDTLLIFVPQGSEPPSANFATLDTRNLHPVLDFDAATNESTVFSFVLPRSYAGGGFTVYIHYAMTSATTLTVDWDISLEQIGDQQLDIDADSFGTATSIDNTTVPGTSGFVDIVNGAISHANAGSPTVGDGMRLKVTRDAVSDDAAGDAELRFVEIKET